MALLDQMGAVPTAASTFMIWLHKWLLHMVYRDGNPLSCDKRAMGKSLAVHLYRCADARDYEVAEKLVLRRADLEQRWEGATALMHVAADLHLGIERSGGSCSRLRMAELLLFHRASVHARFDCR
jgi:hypothetical protein